MAVLCHFIITTLLCTVLGLDSITYTMLEERSHGEFVGNLKTDARLFDEFTPSDYSRLTFSVLAAADSDIMSGNYFTVNETSGVISVLNPLDRDRPDICAFRDRCFVTFDIAIGPNEIFQVITVHVEVEDINDNPPRFSINEYYLNISEVAPIGTSFQLPVVTDLDGEENGIEQMSVSPTTDQFMVRWTRSVNGQVQPRLELLQSLDREQISAFDLSITAMDGGSPVLSAIMLVHVDVVDANDNVPQFEYPGYEVRTAEDRSSGDLITVHAVDIDDGDFGSVRYSLEASTKEQYGSVFEISEVNGIISLHSALDREEQDVYFLGVLATDGAKNGRQASSTVTVYVDDVNDNPPVIKQRVLTASGLVEISESADSGTFVALLSVRDKDWGRNSDITCTLNTADFHLEALNTNKYKVVTSVTLDREKQNSYNIVISCHDHGIPQMSSSEDLIVYVTDVNDHDPVFQHGDVTVHVTENEPPGVELGQLYANDLDLGNNSLITYSSAETFNRYVMVNPETGIVITISRLDRETVQEIEVRVIARDHGTPTRSSTATMTVIVDDTNDNPPVFSQTLYTLVVSENEMDKRELATLKATDKDVYPFNRIEYSLQGIYSQYFDIIRDNGTLYAVKPLDREEQASVNIQVVATDKNEPTFIATANITIYIGDVNDNSPVILFPNFANRSIEIANILNPGDVITQVLVQDLDAGQNAVLDYIIQYKKTKYKTFFSMDSLTGILIVQIELSQFDYEVIECLVIVKDNGIPSLVTESNLTVIINASLVNGGGKMQEASEGDGMSLNIVIIIVATTIILVAILTAAIVFVLRKLKKGNKGQRKHPKVTFEKSGDSELNYGAHHLRCDCEDEKTPVVKIYDPKNPSGRKADVDVESCGSAEGSTTDSGRGASEEGEHGDPGVAHKHNDRSDAKMASVFPGADDSMISGLSFNNSFDNHMTIPRRSSKPNRNHVTFEDDVMVAEIPDTEQTQNNYYNPYNSCPSINYKDTNSQWYPEESEEISFGNTRPPPRTVRNVKAKDRSKKLDTLIGQIANSNPVPSMDPVSHGFNQTPYNFSDSNSLLKYKMHNSDDQSGNASEITDATSTTSGSYIVETDDLMCD